MLAGGTLTSLFVTAVLMADTFIAGAVRKDGKLVTSGGRVLGVTATGVSLAEAVDAAYQKVEKISFEKAYYRRDIGARALEAEIG